MATDALTGNLSWQRTRLVQEIKVPGVEAQQESPFARWGESFLGGKRCGVGPKHVLEPGQFELSAPIVFLAIANWHTGVFKRDDFDPRGWTSAEALNCMAKCSLLWLKSAASYALG